MATVEQPITRSDIESVLQHYATKADLAQLETRLIKWIVGAVAVSSTISATIVALVENLLF